jgi:hypothetical protein
VANALLRAADGLGNLVHVLGLDDSLEVIFEKLGEVVLTGVSMSHISIVYNG